MKMLWLIVVLVSTAAVMAQSPTPTATPTPKPLTAEFKKIAAQTAGAAALIKANHFAGDRITHERLTTASMYSMLHTLDPHSDYLDIEAAEDFKRRINAQYFGVGAAISEISDAEGNVLGTFVREVFKGGPAHGAGLRFGDEIVEVGGVSVKGKGFDEVRPRLLGALGTKVVVVVDRHGDRIANEFVRAAIPTPAIPDAYIIRPGVGYVAMNNTMTNTAHEEFRVALSRLRAAGMTSLILDVRGNTGGSARQACRIVSEFIPRGEVIYHSKAGALTLQAAVCPRTQRPT
jgi:carboxyl-terminal processing protease